jgi:MFS family permease
VVFHKSFGIKSSGYIFAGGQPRSLPSLKIREYPGCLHSHLQSNIHVVAFSSGVKSFGAGLIGTYMPLYFVELGGNPLTLGLVTAAASLVGGLTAILGGVIADSYGRRRIMVLSAFYGILFPALYAIIRDWRVFGILVGFAAIESISRPAIRALIVDSIPPQRRTTVIAFLQVVSSLPMTVTPFIGGYLIQKHGLPSGFRMAAAISAVTALVSALIVLFFLKETLRKSENTNGSESSGVHKRDDNAKIPRRFPSSLGSLMLSHVLVAFANGAVGSYYILYASEIIGLTSLEWAPIASLQSLAVALKIPGGWLSDRFGKKRVMTLSVIACAPCAILFTLSQSFLQALTVSLLLIVTGIYFGPAYEALQADLTPRRLRGRIAALWQSSSFVATACGTAVGGLLFQEIDPAFPFYLFTGTQLLSALVLLILVKEPRKGEA